MKAGKYIRYSTVVLLLIASILLVSYVRAKTAAKEPCSDTNSCPRKLGEFMIFESFTHSLLNSEE